MPNLKKLGMQIQRNLIPFFDNLDHLCGHFLIFDYKKAIGTARVRQKEKNILKIERVAVLLEFRRLKVGSILINDLV